MKIGVCSSFSNIEMAADIGFDYLETQLFALMQMTETEFKEEAAIIQNAGIPCMGLNMFFRPGPFEPGPVCMRIVGPDVDRKKLSDYAKKAGDRAAELGVKYLVFGNGACRRRPDDWTIGEAEESLITSLQTIGEALADRKIMLLLEPVRREESNLINAVSEGAALIRKVGLGNVKLLADFWHMRMINESMDDILEIGDVLEHTHIACCSGRTMPVNSTEDIYEVFFCNLRKIGYTGAMSIEAELTKEFKIPEENARRSLAYLKETALKYDL